MDPNNKITTQQDIVLLVKQANSLLKKAIQALGTTQEQTLDDETVGLSKRLTETVSSMNAWLKKRQEILDQDSEDIASRENNPYNF